MRKLLLIDADEGFAEPLREYFARYGLALESEIDPLRGIEALRWETCELLVLEIMLPGIDGFETCR